MKGKILSSIPYEETVALARILLQAGMSRDEVAGEIADFLDARLNFQKLVKGPVGGALEAIDGPVFKAIATAITAFVIRDAS